jgi:hypothetical protein
VELLSGCAGPKPLQARLLERPNSTAARTSPLRSPPCPRSMPTDVSFGLIGGTGVVSAAQERRPQYALLAAPTPGRENSGPRPGGPLIIGCVGRAWALEAGLGCVSLPCQAVRSVVFQI